MAIYLYLHKKEHAENWVEGKEVPLFLASKYKSEARGGIYTPDENLIYNSSVDFNVFRPVIKIGVGVENITIFGNTLDDQKLPEVFNASRYIEDGLVLCLSTRRDEKIAKQLKKKHIVEILDVEALAADIDRQLKCKSKAKPCRYTWGHERNHFLKSIEDMWQCEYRIFWPLTNAKERWVKIPIGIAKLLG
jgi:hypothetical protein